ncbi:hypothetical protein [Methanobrevibacter sp.]|uniref:hypothetical protein n=1 Tax=Methanobrevibacter sp. TaxID=66852 RepID=UPI00388ED755
MINITRKEEVVFNQIKIFDVEYDGVIPISALKKELFSGSFHEYDLIQVLNSLSNKGLIEFQDENVRLISSDKEVNTVNSKKDLEELELNMKEKESFELIKTLVNEKNLVSKYILEGNLLYGDLKLTNFRMYHIILSLENKGLLKHIHKSDGEYYLLVE